MEQFERNQLLETNLARQHAWIGAADSKASFLFMLNVAMLGLVAALSPRLASEWTVASAIFASFSVAFGLASLLFLSFASFPKTQGPRSSLVFFRGIANRDVDQFKKSISTITLDAYADDLAEQCHRNAEIANRKFIWIQRAMLYLYLAVVPWGIAVYLLYSGRSQ